MSTHSKLRSPVRAYLEMVRVFLTPTAVGDSFAGFSLATLLEPELAAPQRDLLPLACVCSVLAYWLGMASNDWFDFERDRSRALAKPLASGRISRRAGGVFCFVLGLGVIACGTALEMLPLVIALLMLILAYNGGGKAIPLVGNLLMGGARSVNLLLGATAALGIESTLDRPELAGAAVLLGLYITGVTAVSVLEDRPFARGRFLICSAPMLAIPTVLISLAPSSLVVWINSAVLVVLLAAAMSSASRAPTDGIHPAALFVRKALAGIFLVDAGCLAAFAPEGDPPVMEVAVLYLLLLVTRIWTRRWMRAGSTGS